MSKNENGLGLLVQFLCCENLCLENWKFLLRSFLNSFLNSFTGLHINVKSDIALKMCDYLFCQTNNAWLLQSYNLKLLEDVNFSWNCPYCFFIAKKIKSKHFGRLRIHENKDTFQFPNLTFFAYLCCIKIQDRISFC